METFIDKTFDNYLNPDYKVTDDNTNPSREINESTLDEESKLTRLLGVVNKTLSDVKRRYDSIPIEQIRKEVTDTGRMPMIYKTLEQELAEMRTGGNGLLDISDLLGKDLPIESEIIDKMIDLLIIEHYYSNPEIYGKENDENEPGDDSGEKDPKDPTGNGPGNDETTKKKPTPPVNDKNPGDIEHDGKEPPTVEESEFCQICNDYDVDKIVLDVDDGEKGEKPPILPSSARVLGSQRQVTPVIPPIEPQPEPTEPRRAKEMADCAKMDLQLLNIILAVCKMIKALMIIVDPIYAIITQVIEIAALVCGCWSSPANIGEIAQKLLQMALSIVTNVVSVLADKFWKMLGLQCLSEQSLDLIQQIQDALRGIRKINTAVEETANAFAKTVGDAYKDSAKVLKSINDAKEEFLKNRENDFSAATNMFKNLSGSDMSALWTGDKVIKNSILAVIGNNLAGSRAESDIRKFINTGIAIADSVKSKPVGDRFSEEVKRAEKSLARVLKSTHIGVDYDEKNDDWKFDAFGEGTGGKAWDTQIDRLSDKTDKGKYGANFWQTALNVSGITSYKNQGLTIDDENKNAEPAKIVPKNE